MRWLSPFVVLFALLGCIAPQNMAIIDTATNLYQLGNLATTGTHAYKFGKSIRPEDAIPVFHDFANVRVDVLVLPREGAAAAMTAAFIDNLRHLIATELRESKLSAAVCEDCQSPWLTIQFREKDYQENVLQKVYLGNKLRGDFFYIDGTKGTVLKQESLEVADNYLALLEQTRVSVVGKVIKSLQAAGREKEIEAYIDGANRRSTALVKPEHAALLKKL